MRVTEEKPELSGDESAEPETSAKGKRRARVWWSAGVVVAVAVGIAFAVTSGRDGDQPGGTGASPGGQGVTATPTPGETETGEPTDEPSAEETGDGEGTGEAPPDWQPGAVEDPIGLEEEGMLAEDVTARLTRIEAVEGVAVGPGQIAGPSLRVTLEVRNQTAEPISLTAALVQLYYGEDATPADSLSGPGVSEFSGTLDPGETATGVYVFRTPEDQRDVVQVTFGYEPGGDKVAFEGSAPRG